MVSCLFLLKCCCDCSACAWLYTSGLAALGQAKRTPAEQMIRQIRETQRRRGSPLNHMAKPRLSPLCAFRGTLLRAITSGLIFQPAHSVDMGHKMVLLRSSDHTNCVSFPWCPYHSTKRGKVSFLFKNKFFENHKNFDLLPGTHTS